MGHGADSLGLLSKAQQAGPDIDVNTLFPKPKPTASAGIAPVIERHAKALGIDPADLAAVIHYETGGTFSPSIWGGKNNNHLGLIQFGGPERKKYGVSETQSFDEQMNAVTGYLKDRGLQPGMDLKDIYSTVNAGRPGLYDRSDRPGMTVASHADDIARRIKPQVMGMFTSASTATARPWEAQPGVKMPPLPPPIEVGIARGTPPDMIEPAAQAAPPRPKPKPTTAPNRPGHNYRRDIMPFDQQMGAPAPTRSLFGSNAPDILGMLQGLMGGPKPQGAPQAAPQAPRAQAPSPVDTIRQELDTQVRADPVAMQNVGNKTYEDLLKAELLNQLEMESNPGRAISKALAAAGAAMSGGKDIWGGISEGVSAYHGARDDKSGRINTLKSLVDLERKDEGAALDQEVKRGRVELTRAKIAKAERDAEREAKKAEIDPMLQGLETEEKIAGLVAKRRERLGLDDEYAPDAEAKEAELQVFEESLRKKFGVPLGALPGEGAAPQAEPPAEAEKTIGGKRYVKIDGQWYEAAP